VKDSQEPSESGYEPSSVVRSRIIHAQGFTSADSIECRLARNKGSDGTFALHRWCIDIAFEASDFSPVIPEVPCVPQKLISVSIRDDLMTRASWRPPCDDPAPVTPFTVIHKSGKAIVRHYQPAKRRYHTPVVLVYALIKRPFILDLQRGNSVVRDLIQQGFELFLVDWVPPDATDGWRGITSCGFQWSDTVSVHC
jgi:hypothetical protein